MLIHSLNFVHTLHSDPLHSHHSWHEFHFCVHGNGYFNCEQDKYTFSPGLLFFSRPLDAHQVIVSQNKPISFYYILFEAESSDQKLIGRLEERFAKSSYTSLPADTRFLLERLKHKLHSADKDRYEAGRYQFVAFLFDLLSGSVFNPRDKKNTAIEESIRLMQNNIHRPLSLGQLSSAVGLNPSYFSRLFKSKMASPPLRYFQQLKMESARYLLSETDLPIQSIAQNLGYYDVFHFAKTFKNISGQSPGKYRLSSQAQ